MGCLVCPPTYEQELSLELLAETEKCQQPKELAVLVLLERYILYILCVPIASIC